MKQFHKPLKMPANRDALIVRAVEGAEECVSVGGLAGTLGMLRGATVLAAAKVRPTPEPTGLSAISRLVELARRESGLTPDRYAIKVGLEPKEVVELEAGATRPEPRVLHILSDALDVSYQKLLTLAGHKQQRDESLEREALRYAAFSGPIGALSKVEARALHDLLRILHE